MFYGYLWPIKFCCALLCTPVFVRVQAASSGGKRAPEERLAHGVVFATSVSIFARYLRAGNN